MLTESSYQLKTYTDYTFENTLLKENGTATVSYFAIGPVYVPTGEKNMFARPVFRIIYFFAFYNDYAKNNTTSAYVRNVGKNLGQYIGFKTEW